MNIRERPRRPILMAAFGLLAALLLVVLAVRQVKRFSSEGRVWVASAGLGQGALVSEGDMRLASVRGQSLPQGVIRERGQIQGRQLTRRKQAGTPFTADDFDQEPGQASVPPALADSIPEGRVLLPLLMTPNMFPQARLRRGDRIDIVGAKKSGDTELVVRDGFLIGYNRSTTTSRALQEERKGPFGIDLGAGGEKRKEAPLYLYLAVHPEDALQVSRALAASTSLRIVMHSRSDVRAGRVADLGADKKQTVELIRGDSRETVPVAY